MLALLLFFCSFHPSFKLLLYFPALNSLPAFSCFIIVWICDPYIRLSECVRLCSVPRISSLLFSLRTPSTHADYETLYTHSRHCRPRNRSTSGHRQTSRPIWRRIQLGLQFSSCCQLPCSLWRRWSTGDPGVRRNPNSAALHLCQFAPSLRRLFIDWRCLASFSSLAHSDWQLAARPEPSIVRRQFASSIRRRLASISTPTQSDR